MCGLHLEYNISCDGRHDCHRTNGDILRCSEEPVYEYSHEGRVQTELRWEFSQLCVGHTLGHDDCANGNTGNHITEKPLRIVPQDPLCEGKQVANIVTAILRGRYEFVKPFGSAWLIFHVRVGGVE